MKITHVWTDGNASTSLVAATLCGDLAECNPNRDEANCVYCIRALKEKYKKYRADELAAKRKKT